uniref:Putative secreted protein n=1 Tax=Ixodes ricinus TaxID=34613 RepID=A0A147BAG7_IXORI
MLPAAAVAWSRLQGRSRRRRSSWVATTTRCAAASARGRPSTSGRAQFGGMRQLSLQTRTAWRRRRRRMSCRSPSSRRTRARAEMKSHRRPSSAISHRLFG